MVLWIKVLHVIAVISWMAGLLYLPRLIIYHFDSKPGSDQSETFKVMERKLLKTIMTPAMIATWVFGIWTAYLLSAFDEGWLAVKIMLVVLMSAFHMFQAKWVREFREDKRPRSSRFYRVTNEAPAVLMIFIVILVVVKPF